MSKPVILCDVDGVLYNYCGVVSGIADIPESKFDRWKFADNLDDIEKARYEEAVARGRLASHNLNHESSCGITVKEFVYQLSQLGEVVFLTAPLEGCPHWFRDRTDYLKSITDGHRVIWCPTELKHLVYGDVLVEDNPTTASKWANEWFSSAVLISRPWNESANTHSLIFRAASLSDALTLIKRGQK